MRSGKRSGSEAYRKGFDEEMGEAVYGRPVNAGARGGASVGLHNRPQPPAPPAFGGAHMNPGASQFEEQLIPNAHGGGFEEDDISKAIAASLRGEGFAQPMPGLSVDDQMLQQVLEASAKEY